MSNSLYDFGGSLRDAILAGKDTKTELREQFEKNFFQKTGIQLKHSDLDSSSVLFLELDIDEFLLKKSNCDLKEIYGNYYPKGELLVDILSCLKAAVDTCGLISDFLSNVSVIICDYDKTAANIYFSTYMSAIDRETRIAFPKTKFMLRWCHGKSNFYYLIFESETEKQKADQEHMINQIINFVEAFCKRNDPLNIFQGKKILPIVTTKQELKQNGQVMGIMRNNTDFTSF